jgi:phage terminase large subunit-like protein
VRAPSVPPMTVHRGNAARYIEDGSLGPWTHWRKMSRHGRAIKFIETYLRSPKGKGHGQLIKLARFQKEHLEAALADGVDAAILVVPKGNGKSVFGAAVAVWSVFADDETGAPQVPVVATRIHQAIRSCYGVAALMVKYEPELSRRSTQYTGQNAPQIYVPSIEGTLFAMSNDLDGLLGLDPSLAIVDEIASQPIEAWESLITAAGKRPRSLVWATGTPSFTTTNALWSVRERVMLGQQPAGLYYREYQAPAEYAIDDRQGWRVANPALAAGFLRVGAIQAALENSRPAKFETWRLGRWVTGEESFLGEGGATRWQGLTDHYDFVPGAPTWVGVDVGFSEDSTAVVAIQERPDQDGKSAGRLHARLKIWTPTEEDSNDIDDLWAYLGELRKAFQLGKDSIGIEASFVRSEVLSMLKARLPVVSIPTSPSTMGPIVSDLWVRIMAGKLTHEDDKTFEAHVLNARAKNVATGIMFGKDLKRSPMDAAVALALAVDRYTNRPPDRGPAMVV